jgi:flagellar biosynthesis protein FlhG
VSARHQAQSLVDQPPRDASGAPPWVAVAGGKGGVGKTLLAVNLAILAARSGYRTLLADLDPGLANVDVHLRLSPRYTVEDLACGACSPAEAVVRGPAGIGVLAGCSGSTALASGDADHLAAVHRAVQRAARAFDLVVCDTGAGIGPAVLGTARLAAMVLAVTTPDPAAATDAYALIKLLVQRGAPAPHLAVNRVRDREHALGAATRLSTVCQKFLGTRLPFAGWVRNATELERAVVRQKPFAVDGVGDVRDELLALTATVLSALPARRRSRPLATEGV